MSSLLLITEIYHLAILFKKCEILVVWKCFNKHKHTNLISFGYSQYSEENKKIELSFNQQRLLKAKYVCNIKIFS